MPTTACRDLFVELEQRRLAASLGGETAILRRMLHDEFVFIHSSGRVDTREEYLELLSSGALTYLKMESSGADVRSFGESFATVLSRIEFVANYRGRQVEVTALVLTSWVRVLEGWCALSIQSTPI